jgi:hypothetical protein
VEAAVRELAERLRARGVSPDDFVRYAPIAGESREVLEALASLAEQVQERKCDAWSAFQFGAEEIVRAFPEDAVPLLRELGELIAVLPGDSMALQRLPPAIRASKGKPWMARAALGLARDLAKGGADPAEAMRLAFPAIAGSGAGADEKTFAPVAAALREAFLAMDARGVPPTWPIAQGVIAIAGAWRDEPAGMAEAIRGMAELAIKMREAGHVPHPAIEYGLAPALQACEGAPWPMRAEVFPLAFAIASEGRHPGLALERFRGVAVPHAGPETCARLRALGEKGRDVARLLSTVPSLSQAAGDDRSRFDALFDAAVRLLETVEDAGLRTFQLFEEGLPSLFELPAGRAHAARAIELARRIAAAKIDAGPAILHGLVPAFTIVTEVWPEERAAEPIAGAILDAGEALIAEGGDPWPLLDPGVFCAVRVGRRERTAFESLLGELLAVQLSLVRAGARDDRGVLMGLRNLAIGLAGEGGRPIFSSILVTLRDFAPKIAARGFDAGSATNRGLGAAATIAQQTDSAWIVPAAAELGMKLAEAGIDPADVLGRALPAIAKAAPERAGAEALFGELLLTAKASRGGGVPVQEVVAACDSAEKISRALALVRRTAEKSIDGSALAAALAPVAGSSEPLMEAVARFALQHGAVDARLAAGLASCAPVAAGDPAALSNLLEAVAGAAKEARGEDDRDPAGFLESGLRAAAEVATMKGGASFPRLVEKLAQRAARARREKVELAAAWKAGAWRAAKLSGGREEAFLRVLDAFAKVGARRGGPEDALADSLLEHVAPLAAIAARDDADELVRGLEDAIEIRDANRLGADAGHVLRHLGRLGTLVRDVPSAWRDLLVPALRAQAAAASAVLDAFLRMERWIDGDEAVALLKQIVTQEGVRATEILWGLLVSGLERGKIGSLSEERESVLAYLEDVSIVDPSFYERYRAIREDGSKTAAERRTAIAELERGVRELAAAVVEGEVPKAREDDPMLGQVLFHVFPPAVSVARGDFLQLFRSRADHPEHMKRVAATPIVSVRLPKGGYRPRDGETIDVAPWGPLKEAVAAVHAAPGEEPIDALGRDLFAAWLEGGFADSKTRARFLERLYRRFHHGGRSLSASPTSAEELLRHREFLADAAREIAQEALRAVRLASPEQYERLARAKLTPKPYVGPGLVRSVWKTIEQRRAGEIDEASAMDRLSRQLRAFEIEGARLLELGQRAALETALAALPPRQDEPVELGGEHVRIVQEIAGSELAAMQRELFGDGQGRGKLEYRRDAGGGGTAIELEVTKRRAHVAIGFCEGVCTATDGQLWDEPRFLQCVFWGPDDRACGGMHLLEVPREGKKPALALPGINPSIELLGESGADAVLDALLGYATGLAKANGFGAVWIPDHRGILSNRGPIHAALAAKNLPSVSIPGTQFSYRPYSYSFDRVFVAWEAP